MRPVAFTSAYRSLVARWRRSGSRSFGAHACQRLRNFTTAITRFLDGLFLFYTKQFPVNLIQQIALHPLELGQEFPGLRCDLGQLPGSENYEREE